MSADLASLRDSWRARWPEALALWSPYARLSEPLWCLDAKEAAREHLTMSFAMIRLTDHAVVLNLAEIAEKGLIGFPLEVMGHEIGHHIYVPGDLADQGRLLARVRRGIPGFEKLAPLIANLYADLFINDRLQRNHALRLDQIYARLGSSGSVLWRLYLRIDELLWRLERGALVKEPLTDEQEGDAQLGARLIRVYARDWLKGASSFAALCLPYLNEQEGNALGEAARGLLDSGAEGGDAVPDGLSELDPDEEGPVRHPSEDPVVTGDTAEERPAEETAAGDGTKPEDRGGRKSLKRYRDISEYRSLVEQLSPGASADDVTVRYYRERAQPYLIRFPERRTPVAQDPVPEGLETWDIGRPLNEVDWVESVTHSPSIVPGLTTLARVYGETPGQDPKREPLDLYIGIDCSGSMPNPRTSLSHPVLAGFIIALSALRSGARVMACLSGEPGKSIQTEGFRRDRESVLKLLTDYLGMGYSYGIFRLQEMVEQLATPRRPVHILILTDTDIFASLGDSGRKVKRDDEGGWHIAERALREAGGGGTMLLHTPGGAGAHAAQFGKDIERLKRQGWRIAYVARWEDILEFARRFAADLWEQK